MKRNVITVPRRLVYIVIIGLAVLGVLLFSLTAIGRSQNSAGAASTKVPDLAAGSAEQFSLLSGQSGQRSVGST